MHRVQLALALCVTALAVLAPCAQAGDWTVGEITGPPGTTRIEPTAVNASGVVVGHARFPGKTIETAFRWEDGVMIELAVPGDRPYTRAWDINDDGTIVGQAGAPQPCCTSMYSLSGATWTATQTTSSVSLTPYNMHGAFTTEGADKDRGSSLLGINNSGQVVGGASFQWISPFANPQNRPSYTTFPTVGVFARLALPDTMTAETGGTVYGGYAWKINDSGDILGTAGPSASRVWHGGGGTGTGYDIYHGRQGFNNDAHIAGRTEILSGSGTNQDHRALLWNGSEYIRIGADQRQSIANAVNDFDWAVGRAGVFYSVQPRTTGNAWLWRPNEAATPLYLLAPTGWTMANATDINNDGMIVGSGTHGGVEMGYWMAPASIAHTLSGTVYGPDGAPVAGAQVQITNAVGNVLAAPVTGPDGKYTATINRGGPYDITVLGAYLPDGLAGCTIVGTACRLNLGKNRVVNFYGTNIVVPPAPGPAPAPPAPAPAPAPPTGGSSGGSTLVPKPAGPTFGIPAKNKTLTSSSSGVIRFSLGTFSAAADGSVKVQSAAKVKASAKAKVLVFGTTKFKAKKGKALTVKVKLGKKGRAYLKKRKKVRAVAVVTAKTAAGGVTTKRYRLTLKAPKRR